MVADPSPAPWGNLLPGSKIFVDTGAWIALFVEDDSNHRAAREVWDQLLARRILIVTTSYVIDESITAVRAFAGHSLAVKLGHSLFESSLLNRLSVDQHIEREAWSSFQRYADQDFSFTDCTSFQSMKKEHISVAFAFDSDFVVAGFVVVPGRKIRGRRGGLR